MEEEIGVPLIGSTRVFWDSNFFNFLDLSFLFEFPEQGIQIMLNSISFFAVFDELPQQHPTKKRKNRLEKEYKIFLRKSKTNLKATSFVRKLRRTWNQKWPSAVSLKCLLCLFPFTLSLSLWSIYFLWKITFLVSFRNKK